MNVKRSLSSVLALVMSSYAGSGCNVSADERGCGGPLGGEENPAAVDAGIPACGSALASERVAACDTFCGPQGGLAVGPCCISVDQPGVLDCPVDCTGRRPEGLVVLRAPRGANGVGAFFARAAFLEGASIAAFRVLEDDLVRFGAPRRLVRAARRAKRDERRHYRVTRALARRHGGEDVAVAGVGALPGRVLVDVAIENAREGCVRETFGALVATWQAYRAGDPDVRAALRRIARDEVQHAELAWKVHAFLTQRMSRAERGRVGAALREAADALVQRSVGVVDAHVGDVVGAPSAEVTAQLASAWVATMGAKTKARA